MSREAALANKEQVLEAAHSIRDVVRMNNERRLRAQQCPLPFERQPHHPKCVPRPQVARIAVARAAGAAERLETAGVGAQSLAAQLAEARELCAASEQARSRRRSRRATRRRDLGEYLGEYLAGAPLGRVTIGSAGCSARAGACAYSFVMCHASLHSLAY